VNGWELPGFRLALAIALLAIIPLTVSGFITTFRMERHKPPRPLKNTVEIVLRTAWLPALIGLIGPVFYVSRFLYKLPESSPLAPYVANLLIW
jgi:hypothetical protein